MLVELNRDIIDKLTKTEYDVITFINSNAKDIPNMSIENIAYKTFSSPATVSRAIKKCGMAGFNELRYRSSKLSKETEITHVGNIINKSMIECQRVIEQISIKKILEIIKIVKESKRIYVLARGMSEYVAKEFSFKLQLLGFNVMLIHESHIMTKISKYVKPEECVFIFSLNGETSELIESAQNANYCGAKLVSCCCNKNSKLLELSNVYLLGYVHEHIAIQEYEVISRVSLSIMSRIIIDYIAIY